MRLFRIGPDQHIGNMSGMGGSYRDGAGWNSAGVAVLYFGTSPSVAMLELGNYVPSPRDLPDNYRLAVFEVPDDEVETWSVDQLPVDWADFSYPSSIQQLGTQWLRQREKLVLLVPSCAVAGGMENIAVVNPMHPDVSKIRLLEKHAAIYNERMFKGI
ncbi:RES family NAD+ phosphorylase [Litchfieldella rifensis]|uniref:RES family NAD+ phosphorylase n=1 Tax=Litchfieldella rifensis TaxID=762643 RepID=A0ABV7LJ56_9GAMM